MSRKINIKKVVQVLKANTKEQKIRLADKLKINYHSIDSIRTFYKNRFPKLAKKYYIQKRNLKFKKQKEAENV